MREPTRLPQANPVPALAERARAYFRSEATRSLEARLGRLKALQRAMQANEERIFAALKTDLSKPLHEAYPAEVGIVYEELTLSLKQVGKWMKPERRGLPLLLWPGSGARHPEPLGTTLIIAPWNYPFQLAMSPLVGAIAAGCNAVLKPSELAPATAEVIEHVCREAFGDDGFVTIVQGGPEVSTALLAERWDLVFFTGSTRVGQIVMEAAAKHLTPCVLELGGKSPCIVDEDTDLTVTARRVMWGKAYNAGQTCIAPDYVLVHKNVRQAFVDACGTALRDFYGPDVAKSPDYGRIITARHFTRLQSLMAGGRVAFGGQSDEASRFIAPTLLTDVDLSHPLMQEEIFGPLLPIIEVPDVAAAIRFVNERPKPLALYVFSRNSAKVDEVLRRVSAGGAVVNDTIVHVAAQGLPFGGVGSSGTGSYHGKASFDAFTHYKSVVKKPFAFDLKVRYPPYKTPLSVLKRLIG
jgi:aldehyde dehydrogenase (NAD+)